MDDLKLSKSTEGTTAAISGYYREDEVLVVFQKADVNLQKADVNPQKADVNPRKADVKLQKVDVDLAIEQYLTQRRMATSNIKVLIIRNCPKLTNMSLPIKNWGHLEVLIMDESIFASDDFKGYSLTSAKYTPSILGTLLKEINAIGTAINSKLRFLALDFLEHAGEYLLLNISLFKGCPSLVGVSFKTLITAQHYFLYSNPVLKMVYAPLLMSVMDHALGLCPAIEKIFLKSLKEAKYWLLSYCKRLETADFPSLERVKGGFLHHCPNLRVALFHKLTITAEDPLALCDSLKIVYFGAKIIFQTTQYQAYFVSKNEDAKNENPIYLAFQNTDTRRIVLYLCDKEYALADLDHMTWKGLSFKSIIKGAPPQ
jgi:hypothetical protein